ncbi:hypothetical protein RDV89_13875 [Nocardioides zeae]|uniref:Sirohydrochlorin ferrochelatase n=1 Tax=Nocardioides imazamoxiresistens TaxID=3231893 RepID=A0ABU3PY48_9ACTN|nr:hypothetical protein [Nocardioides zeae]MDT9594167.1 hypothetical protein [Nocardioides zeae]
MSERPVLVTVTPSVAGRADHIVARAVAVQAARRLGGVPRAAATSRATVEREVAPSAEGDLVHLPVGDRRDLSRLLVRLDEAGLRAVVVPLALGSGPAEVARLGGHAVAGRVAVTPPLGAHPLVVDALVRRVAAVGLRERDTVVLAGADDDLRAAAALLRSRRGGADVRTAGLLDADAPLADRVVEVRRAAAGRVVVAPWVLGPGEVFDRVRAGAEVAGADAVAEPVGAHPMVVALVARRYLAGARLLDAAARRVRPGALPAA